MIHPRVLDAMSMPLIGHLDPAFLEIMDEIQQRLRGLFQTQNRLTIAVSGTASAGMEAALVNLIEPGEAVIVGVNGVFGTRMVSIVERCGGTPVPVEAPWGRIIEPAAIEAALLEHAPVKAVALVHAETSTGVQQPLEHLGALCRRYGALLIVDAVTSLGGIPVEVDTWGVDVCYSGTQKCVSCPPGLSPLTVSEQALASIRSRRTPCRSWYLDLSLITEYWRQDTRAYHHTAPISMLYALREALRIIEEEGLGPRWARHRLNSQALMTGLAALGFQPFAQDGHRLPTLHCVTVPPQVDEAAVRTVLLQDYGIEIGGGLGPLRGRVWRIGLMGESSSRAHVWSLLHALDDVFVANQWVERSGLPLEAASTAYAE